MGWLTDEILFYGGMAAAGGALAAALIYCVLSHIGMIRLCARLEAEYGAKQKK